MSKKITTQQLLQVTKKLISQLEWLEKVKEVSFEGERGSYIMVRHHNIDKSLDGVDVTELGDIDDDIERLLELLKEDEVATTYDFRYLGIVFKQMGELL